MPIATPVTICTTSSATVGTVSSFAGTTTANILAGDTVVVGVYLNTNNGVNTASVSDGTNSYTKADTSGVFSATEISLWYKLNAAAVSSGASITATFNTAITSGASNGAAVFAARIPANALAMILDAHTNNTAASATSVSATTAALAQTDEIAIGAACQAAGSNSYSGSTGFTNLASAQLATGDGTPVLDYQILNSTSAVTYAPTWGGSGRCGCAIATFKLPPFVRRRGVVNFVDKRIGFSF